MTRSRNAFTLVELLVVMALMAVLATLTIAFFPGVATSAREARAGTLLQGWLNIAKQRALRDQVPTGVRLLIDPTAFPAAKRVVQCQYIAQPDDYAAGTMTSVNAAAPFDTVQITGPGIDLLNGYTTAPADEKYWAVQKGDFLEVNGSGLVYRIWDVAATGVKVSPPLPNKLTSAASYRIIRAPRVAGDETLKLPDNTFVDLDTNVAFSNPLPTNALGDIDILFAPSGAVISRNVATDKIHLWVRALNVDFPTDPFRGDPTLISIFVRTGFVGAYPPDKVSVTNPYSLVK